MVSRRRTRSQSFLAGIWERYAQANEFLGVAQLDVKALFAVGAAAFAVVGAMTLIEPVRRWTGFDQPLLAVAILSLGLTTSYLGGRFWDRKLLRDILLALDTVCYCAFAAALMVHTVSPIRYVFGLIFSQVAADYGRRLPFNWVTFVGIALVPTVLALGVWPDFGVLALVIFGLMMYAFTSVAAAEHSRLMRENAQLSSAFSVADRVASNSVDIALATTIAEMGGFVHHLRNALTPVTNHLRFLAESEALTDDDRVAVEAARRSAGRSVELLEKLVATIKHRSAVVDVAFSLDAMLRELASASAPGLAGTAASARITLVEPVPEFDVRGNPDHLRMALENMTRNAFEAGAKVVQLRAAIEPGGQSVSMLLNDDGPGIPAEIRDALFNRPVTHGKQHGHGFGIYVSRRLVELLGGSVALGRTGPEGTEFVMHLPGHCRMTSASAARAEVG